jgi:hypothetical protein
MDSRYLSRVNPQGQALLGALEVSLINLREKWPQGWPGLALVFERCVQQLGLSATRRSPRLLAVARCAQEVAAVLEQHGRQQQRHGQEPHYHNRLHMADTLVCMTLLLQAQRVVQGARSTTTHRHEWLALLAMLAHDLLHDGSVNQYPAQLESRSADALQPYMQRHGVHESDQRVVRHLILKTDPLCVRQTHAQVADRSFSVDDVDCLAVLVEEADILASTLAVTATDLTRSLSTEWERSNPAMAPVLLTREGRLRFLQFGALFSSPASQWMGIQEARQAEMDSLMRELAEPSTPSHLKEPHER